ncbi:hypothetical protein BOO91_14575 [Vibrio navarrensis]|uniref:Uncharacterized protein n=1 Tax=Vibrio navarrensis TaxID=29495 RepID=A0AAJ4I9G5_9VIBR|nr:helix-turn-helix domain-containing protein [Vibrio navarrensis]MBE3662155.1 hypothetical protein [Vibrio navarrensis]QPL52429.1 hypothetical protein I3X05_10400 [Vibrio navarrensis]
MSIIRSARKVGFTIINNAIFDSGLSPRAIGVLTYLLSKPDNWEVSPAQLVKCFSDTAAPIGRDAVYATITELVEKGFVERRQRRNGSGRMSGVDYVVFDEPLEKPDAPKPDTDNTETVDEPDTAEPETAEPYPAEPTLINTDLLISTDHLTNTEFKQEKKSKPKKAQALDFSNWPTQPSDQVLSDWQLIRNKKRAPLTQTAINRLRPKLELAQQKLGLTADDVLGICVERGWQGFEVEWLENHLARSHAPISAPPQGRQSALEARNQSAIDQWLGTTTSTGNTFEHGE